MEREYKVSEKERNADRRADRLTDGCLVLVISDITLLCKYQVSRATTSRVFRIHFKNKQDHTLTHTHTNTQTQVELPSDFSIRRPG